MDSTAFEVPIHGGNNDRTVCPIMGIRAGVITWPLSRERFEEPGPGQEL